MNTASNQDIPRKVAASQGFQWVVAGFRLYRKNPLLLSAAFGVLFGVVRGVLVVLMLVLLAGLTDLPKEAAWRNAWLSKPLEGAALLTKTWLPDKVAQRVHY